MRSSSTFVTPKHNNPGIPGFYDGRDRHFINGYFIGQNINKTFELLDTSLNALLKTINQPKRWLEKLVSIKQGKSTLLYNPLTNNKISLFWLVSHQKSN